MATSTSLSPGAIIGDVMVMMIFVDEFYGDVMLMMVMMMA